MIFTVFFEDNDDYADMRALYMEKHLSFLESNADQITAAGPLIDIKNNSPAGGLWLVEANDSSEVDDLVKRDPFWPTGLRKSVAISQWKQVYSKGERLVKIKITSD